MGSGHVLVYAFDVFIKLYVAEGYSEREAAELIMTHNLFGLEIDKRAFQLAYFALMMKGRQYSRRILNKNIKLNLHQFSNIDNISEEFYARIEELSLMDKDQFTNTLDRFKVLVDKFKAATEIGSVINVTDINFTDVEEFRNLVNVFPEFSNMDELYAIPVIHEQLNEMLDIVEIMIAKYAAVVTNPPYLNKMSGILGSYVTANYKDVKTDLFSVFIKMNSNLLEENGYAGFMTPFVWMFIKSYEQLRDYLITNKSISSLIQMEYSAFEEATVPVCCFTIKNTLLEPIGNYFKLSDFKGGMKVQEEKVLEGIQNPEVSYFYQTNQENFKKIPGEPISFWVSENVLNSFDEVLLRNISISDGQTKTGNNNKYLRLWYEISFQKFGKKNMWVPHAKGGTYRRWYGNLDTVINWSNEARLHYQNDNVARIAPEHIWFRKGISWTLISSSNKLSMRVLPDTATFNLAAPSIFIQPDFLNSHILGLLNSPVAENYRNIFNPTLNTNIGDILNIPIISGKEDITSNIVEHNIKISKNDWDIFENSWDFKKHSLI
ncbi:hypothetical protein JOD14_001587 [Enterococcus lemanii]|uniref:BREX-1 system adenine-specific DNA-methyltransferase PglX n=1 Tax=Enterococcus lemanii TaxID=1159752 RepID=UPI001958EA9C|nr:hypothetical protein [Enterococcus lemanii]